MSTLPEAQKEVQPEKPMLYVHQGAAPKYSPPIAYKIRETTKPPLTYSLFQQIPAQSRLSAKRTSRAAQTQAVDKGLVCPAGLVRGAAKAES